MAQKNISTTLSQADWPLWGNMLGLLGIICILGFAFGDQIIFHELPCPLCLLQRLGFCLIGICFMANLQWGTSVKAYGLLIISAIFTGLVATRQVFLHIHPDDGGYGARFFGLHFYTWAFLLALALVLYTSVLLCIHKEPAKTYKLKSKPAQILMILFIVLVVANLVGVVLQCGMGPCADDPVVYDLLA